MAREKRGKKKKRSEEGKARNPEDIAEVIGTRAIKAAKGEEGKRKEGTKKGKIKGKKKKKALKEHTAIRFVDKKKGKNRKAVWVGKFTLEYEAELQKLQIELLKWQKHVIAKEQKVLLIFEGRDAAGKGGTIKRIVEHLNPRGARVVALLKPSDRERTQWYFQRYFQQLPSGGEIVLFDRSWYNRAMVEPTMGFCTDEEHKRFLKDVDSGQERNHVVQVLFLRFQGGADPPVPIEDEGSPQAIQDLPGGHGSPGKVG